MATEALPRSKALGKGSTGYKAYIHSNRELLFVKSFDSLFNQMKYLYLRSATAEKLIF